MIRRMIIIIISAVLLTAFGCSSSRLNLEPISKNYGLLSFESGAMIKELPEETKADMMKNYCAPRDYEIIEKGGKTVGQYRFLTKVLFRCIEKKENR